MYNADKSQPSKDETTDTERHTFSRSAFEQNSEILASGIYNSMDLMPQDYPVSTYGSQLWEVWGVRLYPCITKPLFQETPQSMLA
jgi:hypothetical protein